jgi:hypothetical protein
MARSSGYLLKKCSRLKRPSVAAYKGDRGLSPTATEDAAVRHQISGKMRSARRLGRR